MTSALVIGAGGGLGRELLRQLACDPEIVNVVAVSRTHLHALPTGVIQLQADETEESIKAACDGMAGRVFNQVFCCLGMLHSDSIQPEKRLEDINASAMARVFHVNTVLPALWLKYLLPLTKSAALSSITVFSARVGSISDNRLGGWYSYRASKSALNMVVKTAQVEYNRRAKNVMLVCYHPGTVDTGLSKPFQANVPEGKLFTSEYSIGQLRAALADLDPDASPHYIDWRGQSIPW